VELPPCTLRYLYARAGDSRTPSSQGQDYLAWRYAQDVLGFVVCDGVGGSFCGHIAAAYLGEQLLRFVFEVGPTWEAAGDTPALAEQAAHYLNSWRADGQRLVENVILPPNLPALQVQALEQLRQDYGSETMFVAGRLNFQTADILITLLWMGDVRVQLFDRTGQQLAIGATWRTADRWSTRHGVNKRGAQVHTWQGSAAELAIERLIAFSDGFSSVADRLPMLNDDQVQQLATQQLLAPTSDDISFLDVRLKQPDPVGPDARP
jgi:hypothetical protein